MKWVEKRFYTHSDLKTIEENSGSVKKGRRPKTPSSKGSKQPIPKDGVDPNPHLLHGNRLRQAFTARPRTFVLLCLCLAGALLYFNSLHNEFVFDDTSLVLNNQRIQTLKNIPDILGFTGHFSYRPLRELSYVLDYQITGLNPVGYHLFNILYHILSSYVVFLIASLLSKDRKVGLITALLFVAHPIQTESVTYISGRRDILTSLFYFIGFYSFLRFRESPSKRYLLLFFVSYFLSILSKEMGVTLPAVVLVYDFLQLSSEKTGPGPVEFLEQEPDRPERDRQTEMGLLSHLLPRGPPFHHL